MSVCSVLAFVLRRLLFLWMRLCVRLFCFFVAMHTVERAVCPGHSAMCMAHPPPRIDHCCNPYDVGRRHPPILPAPLAHDTFRHPRSLAPAIAAASGECCSAAAPARACFSVCVWRSPDDASSMSALARFWITTVTRNLGDATAVPLFRCGFTLPLARLLLFNHTSTFLRLLLAASAVLFPRSALPAGLSFLPFVAPWSVSAAP